VPARVKKTASASVLRKRDRVHAVMNVHRDLLIPLLVHRGFTPYLDNRSARNARRAGIATQPVRFIRVPKTHTAQPVLSAVSNVIAAVIAQRNLVPQCRVPLGFIALRAIQIQSPVQVASIAYLRQHVRRKNALAERIARGSPLHPKIAVWLIIVLKRQRKSSHARREQYAHLTALGPANTHRARAVATVQA
jgi:hypothetical protein